MAELSFSGEPAGVEQAERTWRPLEAATFAAYEDLTGRRFRCSTYGCTFDRSLGISGLTLARRGVPLVRVQPGMSDDALRITLIHELAHVIALEHSAWHLRKLAALWLVAPTMRVAALTDHLLANVLHEAVAARVLDDPEAALAIARSWRGLRGAWRVIDRQPARVRRIVLGPGFDAGASSA